MVSNNEYMRVYMLKRYHERRSATLVLLGGKCVRCGATELLEIDHIDRSTKGFDLTRLWSIVYSEYLEEVAKCQILCRSCHLKKTIAENSVDHGGGLSGKKNCPCAPCKKRKAEYMREYKKNRRARQRPSTTVGVE